MLPQSLKSFNWAAFLLGPVWGLGNGVPLAILIGVAGLAVLLLTRSALWAGGLSFIAAEILIGFKANEWAWRARRWHSMEQFKRVQQAWLLWAVVITVIVSIVLALFYRQSAT